MSQGPFDETYIRDADAKWEKKQGSASSGQQSDASSWRDDLMLTPTKQPRPLLANALIALRKAPEWQGVLAYDDFALTTMAAKPPPWLKPYPPCSEVSELRVISRVRFRVLIPDKTR